MSDKRSATKEQVAGEVKATTKELEAAKKEKRVSRLTAPPAPITKIGDVFNPIIEKRGLKRALVVAIVQRCTKDGKVDLIKAQALVRASGIPYKQGYKDDNPSDLLTQSEWSGLPYVRFATQNTLGKVYSEKHSEKVKLCEKFALELDRVTKETVKEEKQKVKDENVVAV